MITQEKLEERDKWLEVTLKSLPMDVMGILGVELKDTSAYIKNASFEEKELFKAILIVKVKETFRTYNNWKFD